MAGGPPVLAGGPAGAPRCCFPIMGGGLLACDCFPIMPGGRVGSPGGGIAGE